MTDYTQTQLAFMTAEILGVERASMNLNGENHTAYLSSDRKRAFIAFSDGVILFKLSGMAAGDGMSGGRESFIADIIRSGESDDFRDGFYWIGAMEESGNHDGT